MISVPVAVTFTKSRDGAISQSLNAQHGFRSPYITPGK
jgi:hypothetical protein